jgi:hypothetical protein
MQRLLYVDKLQYCWANVHHSRIGQPGRTERCIEIATTAPNEKIDSNEIQGLGYVDPRYGSLSREPRKPVEFSSADFEE